MDTPEASLFESWAAGLPGGMTPREHFVDSIAYIVEELGEKAWSDEALLNHFVRDNLGWTMSAAGFVRQFPWILDALAEARVEGMKAHAFAKEHNFSVCLRRLPGGVRCFAGPPLAILTDEELAAVVAVVKSDIVPPSA